MIILQALLLLFALQHYLHLYCTKLSHARMEELVLYWIQYKISLKYKVGCFWRFLCVYKINKKRCVVTIAMTCSTLASLWKFQYLRRSVYNPVEHLWWSFYCENSKRLSIFTKKHHHIIACLGSKYDTAFTWRLLKIFSLKDSWFLVLYFF